MFENSFQELNQSIGGKPNYLTIKLDDEKLFKNIYKKMNKKEETVFDYLANNKTKNFDQTHVN